MNIIKLMKILLQLLIASLNNIKKARIHTWPFDSIYPKLGEDY